MHPEQRALLNAIIAAPDDDAPRLVYADWLDENDGPTTCHKCNGARQIMVNGVYGFPDTYVTCPICNGSGYEFNQFAERALFIRCQLKLPDVDNCFCQIDGILSEAHIKFDYRLAYITANGSYIHKRFVYRRGFVYKIVCAMNNWLDHGPEIVRDHPITRVEITDKKPSYQGRYIWYQSNGENYMDSIPNSIFNMLLSKEKDISYYVVPYGDGIKDALSDLSQACIAWAKEQRSFH